MDNRTKERKPPDKGRVKMKPPDGLKAMPKELAVGAIQDGTQRIMSQLRDAGQREERSDYGGERIEAAVADGTRLAARSVEAFLKSGAAALSRNKGEEPPPDDSPLDESSPQEMTPETDAASVAEELPATEYPPLLEHAENSLLPEHTVSPETPQTESVLTSEPLPQTERPPLPEHSDFPETVTPTETPVAEKSQAESRSKRHSQRKEEPVQTEQSEESWRPAYQDATPTASVRPVTVIVKKSGGAVREDPGRVPRGREGGALRHRNADRTVKTLAGNDAPPLLKGHSAREAAALPPPAGQPAAVEYGRRKLIRERGQELAAKRADVPLLEGNAPTEPSQLPANGAEYPAPQMPEPPVTRTGEASPNLRDVLPEQASVGDSRVTVRTKETAPFAGQPNADKELVKEREPLPSAPRSGNASTSGNGSSVTPNGVASGTESAPKAPQTGRVGVKTREASGYRAASSGADAAPTAAVQGKQKAVRETAERVAERRTDAIPVKRESVTVPPETPVTLPGQSAVPVKMKTAYAQNETPSADTPSGVQGKEKLIRERTAQVAGRRRETASAGQTPPSVPEQESVPVKTREAYAQKVTPAETQSAAQGKQKLVRERVEQVAERGADMAAGRESAAVIADTSAPVSEREAVSVKTKEAYATRETPSADTSSAAQGKGKLARERTEQFAGRRVDAATEQNPAVKVKTSVSTPEQPLFPVRTTETEIAAEPQNVAQGKSKAIRERAEQVAERPVDAVSVKRESVPETSAPTPERLPVKTKEAYLSTETPSADTHSAAQVRQKAIPEHTEQIRERRT